MAAGSWRPAKGVVASNQTGAVVDEQAEHAGAWLATVSHYTRLLTTGLFST